MKKQIVRVVSAAVMGAALLVATASPASAATTLKAGSENCGTQNAVAVKGQNANIVNDVVTLSFNGSVKVQQRSSLVVSYFSTSSSGSWQVSTASTQGLTSESGGLCAPRQ